MPLYFFDIQDGAQHVRDECGSILQDFEETKKVAMGILSDMARSFFLQAIQQNVSINIRDQTGHYIYTVTLLLVPRQLE